MMTCVAPTYGVCVCVCFESAITGLHVQFGGCLGVQNNEIISEEFQIPMVEPIMVSNLSLAMHAKIKIALC